MCPIGPIVWQTRYTTESLGPIRHKFNFVLIKSISFFFLKKIEYARDLLDTQLKFEDQIDTNFEVKGFNL